MDATDDRPMRLAKALTTWDKKWAKDTIYPVMLQRQCDAELRVLIALAECIVADEIAEGRSE